MPHWLVLVLLAAASYFAGTFSPAVLISKKEAGFDIRTKGSGNAGTTNMLRVIGWKAGVLTFIADVAKGALTTLLGLHLSRVLGMENNLGAYIAGAAVLLGHAYPVFNKFRGGKCVATAGGVWLAMMPVPTLIAAAAAVGIMALTRRVSVGSIAGALGYPAVMFFLPSPPIPDPVMPWFSLAAGLLIAFLHRANIVRLLRGEEKPLTIARKK